MPEIRISTQSDIEDIIELRRKIFPDCTTRQHKNELELTMRLQVFDGFFIGKRVCFVAEDNDSLVGFVEVMIRSHAEGAWEQTETGDLGIAHLEGVWVEEEARGKGVGRLMVQKSEAWASKHGGTHLASDAKLENVTSHKFHKSLGFEEVERSVHYIKACGLDAK